MNCSQVESNQRKSLFSRDKQWKLIRDFQMKFELARGGVLLLPGIPGCFGNLGLKNGGGQM